ncbi:6887_t:CDS:2 [Paraglomus brasilianum]|uniref:6887_t:CDS:1 n=1 Tax=Paraglomus brasilianum TaxID=144538 RepID=A0A9N9CZC0_9GLOM|nr:6887_t:CDS:2 [Paraglomus brasilianum]
MSPVKMVPEWAHISVFVEESKILTKIAEFTKIVMKLLRNPDVVGIDKSN